MDGEREREGETNLKRPDSKDGCEKYLSEAYEKEH
jgi:hypothetical protein